MRVWKAALLSGLSWRRQIGSERCSGRGSAPLWAGAWETSSSARTDTDWVWHCVQEARRGLSFALFFNSPKLKEPHFFKELLLLWSPPASVVFLALLLGPFSFTPSLHSYKYLIFNCQIKSVAVLFLLSFFFIVPLTRIWTINMIRHHKTF